MNNKLTKLVKTNRQLFWDIGENSILMLNNEAIVERLMGYGDMSDIHTLEKAISTYELQKIFDRLKKKKRVNLEPETINFFNIYLSRNVS